jgi:hypothetical protein
MRALTASGTTQIRSWEIFPPGLGGGLYGTLLLLRDSRNPVILAYGRPNTLLARTQSRSDLPPGSQLGGGLYGTVLLFEKCMKNKGCPFEVGF